jgi:cell division protein FtsA
LHLTVLPIGSANITNDIAIGLKTDVAAAERLKIEKGTCVFKGGDKKIKLDVGPDKAVGPVFSQRMLSRIISERVMEIFDLANKELKKAGREGKLPAGVVLCGGGVKLPQIGELAKKVFKLTVSVGVPGEFSNLDADPSLAVACGLVASAWEEREDEISEAAHFSMGGGGWGRIKKFFKIFIP